jgi:hypothetical protein
LPVEIKEEKDVCDGCGKHRSEIGIVRFREQLGINKHLCSKCCHRALGDYDKICCKCDKNNADGSFEMKQYNGKDMCADCIEKEELKRKQREAKEEKRNAQKLAVKDYFKKKHLAIIGLILATLAIYFGYFSN